MHRLIHPCEAPRFTGTHPKLALLMGVVLHFLCKNNYTELIYCKKKLKYTKRDRFALSLLISNKPINYSSKFFIVHICTVPGPV